jgi:plastocyanin
MPLEPRRASLAALAAAAALALAACGDDEEEATSPSDSGEEPAATVDVSEVDFAIEPENATVDESGLIEFAVTNDGETAHALEIESEPEEAVSDTIESGDSTTFTAELDPGEYKWYCPIGDHEQRGMVGTLTVGGGPGGSSEEESGDSGSGGGGSPSY